MNEHPSHSELPVILASCGASGQIYARWILQRLTKSMGLRVRVILTENAKKIVSDELGYDDITAGLPAGKIQIEDSGNLSSELASGSIRTQGMIICPCTLNTLAALASGISDNLIKRAAQVHLKQRRKLVVAVREMPLGIIDMENMLKLSYAGAIVTPISPPFYHHPETIDHLTQFTADKIVQLLTDFETDFRYHPKG